ncbi:MAG TPA: methyl-accepting chemotaxis protein [Fibrobacteraceae bacterium]|nr:methyl-accepting chemotaxis protein [Fibrobacteraceae bacterium]
MFKNMKLGVRLGLGFGLMIVLMAVLVIVSITRVTTLNENIDLLVRDRMVKVHQADVLVNQLNVAARAIRNMFLVADTATMKKEESRLGEAGAVLTATVDSLKQTIRSEQGKKLLATVEGHRAPFLTKRKEMLDLFWAGKRQEAVSILLTEYRDLQNSYMVSINELIAYQTRIANEDGAAAGELAADTRQMLLMLALLALALGLGAAWLITRSITRPVARCMEVANQVAAGDTSIEINVDSSDETGMLLAALKRMVGAIQGMSQDTVSLAKAAVEGKLSSRADASKHQGDFRSIVQGINETLDAVIQPMQEAAAVLEKVANRDMTARMNGNYNGELAQIKSALNMAVDNLDKALGQVNEATMQVSSAAQQISAGSQSLAQGANEQASSLEEVSSSLEEMSSMTKQNADNAAQARTLSAESNDSAKTGSEAMERMSGAINRIKESSDQTAKIVKTIDEIAMQTNLLALNAAVEAARAGEAGRGFAVVAEEVRNLAQRSAQAAKNTADMIGESVKNADDGVKIAEEVSNSFSLIAGGAGKVNDLISEIAAASKEQAQGIEQVSTAVSQMDKVTQQNAANAEESASAAEELSSQSEELQGMVGQFQITQASATPMVRPISHHPKHTALPHQTPKPNSNGNPNGLQGKKMQKHVSAEEIIPMEDEALKEF